MRLMHFLASSAVLLAAAFSAGPAAAASEKLLYSFTGGIDGAGPSGGVVADASGALYGVTQSGGTAQLGVVYKLTPPAAGQTKWTETVLHSFQGLDQGDGNEPQTVPLMDKAGALYGTTLVGGIANNGTFYRLTPPTGGVGPWRENVLYSFCPNLGVCPDGQRPFGLTAGPNGEFYSVTAFGGPLHGGAIVRLTPPAPGKGTWTETVLAGLPRGSAPTAGVILDASGALYGTTSFGGAFNMGAVYKATPPAKAGSNWTIATIWSFGRTIADGHLPLAAMTLGADGTLYGTTALGGSSANAGIVYQLIPPGAGHRSWQEIVLRRFTGKDGAAPLAKLVFDRKGALYGTLAAGGTANQGSVFKLTRPSAGTIWAENVLHAFGAKADAAVPTDPVLVREANLLFGTAAAGGRFDWGAVYQIVP